MYKLPTKKMLAGDSADNELATRNKIILNVGGFRHETYVGTLRNIPDSRLYSLTNNNPTQVPEFDPSSGEYFFDRHPLVFTQILNYYRTGKLHCPSDVCGPVFEEELAFWGLEDASIETCCWMNYRKHGEAQANLSSFDKMVEEAASEHEYSLHEDGGVGLQTRSYRQVLRKYKSKIWLTLEEPSSSLKAKLIAMLSMFLIITSVITSCLETVDYFSESQSRQHQILQMLEVICVIWFTTEIMTRFMVCPSKRKFLTQPMNWLDFAAIMPFYVQLFITNTDMNSIVALRIIRLIRVFRVFKLSRHSYSLQILGHTLRSSLSELFLLGFFLSIGVVVFSTLMFYAEQESKTRKFSSIPAGFWWAVVTMTTLGYGDIVPDTLPGKIVGTACAICGVLTIALPIPVIVSNFSLYYSHAKAKQKATQRKRPLVIGAANALKVIDPFVGSRATTVRLSAISDNASYLSPVVRRNWAKFALDLAGSSFDSSEAPQSPTRRRLSKLPDKIWQFDQAIRFDNNNAKQSTLAKSNTNEISAHENLEHETCAGKKYQKDIGLTNDIDFKHSDDESKIASHTSISCGVQDNDPNKTMENCFNQNELSELNGGKENATTPFNGHYECKAKTFNGAHGNEEIKTFNECYEKTANTFNGAYENDGVEPSSENENNMETSQISTQFDVHMSESDEDYIRQRLQSCLHRSALPKIEIICNSSASQMSGSNNEDEISEKTNKKLSKKTKKKLKRSHLATEKASSASALTATRETFSAKNLPGRMGRRGSVFVVGFLGKRWQAKAAKNRRNRSKPKPENIEHRSNKSDPHLLQVSPSPSSRGGTSNLDSCRTSITSFNTPSPRISSTSTVFRFPSNRLSSPSFFRRSSCPALQNLETSVDLKIIENCGKKQNEDDQSVTKYHDVTESDRKVVESIQNAMVCGQNATNKNLEINTSDSDAYTCNSADTKNEMEKMNEVNKEDTFQNKKNGDSQRISVITNDKEHDIKQCEGGNRSTEINQKICKNDTIVDIDCTGLTKKSSEKHKISKANKTDTNSKKGNSERDSRSSDQSRSSLKTKFDGSVRRSSSPLLRQRAFMSFHGREGKILDDDDSDNETEGNSVKQYFVLDYDLETTFNQNNGKNSNSNEKKRADSDITTDKQRKITLIEIGKDPLFESKFSLSRRKANDSRDALTNDRNTQESSERTTNTNGQKIKHGEHNANKLSGGKINKIKSVKDYQDTMTKPNSWEEMLQSTSEKRSSNEIMDKDGKSLSYYECESNKTTTAKILSDGSEIASRRNKGLFVKSLKSENDDLENDEQNSRTFTVNVENDPLTNVREARHNTRGNGDNHSLRNQRAKNDFNVDNDNHNHYNTGEDNTGRPIVKYATTDIPDNEIQKSTSKKPLTNNMSNTNEAKTKDDNVWKQVTVNKSCPKKLARGFNSQKSSISIQSLADRSKSFDYSIDCNLLRKIEAQDSGVYCSEYRSSIDSLSSMTERSSDRGMLKTISESDCDNMRLLQPFSSQYCQKNTSFVLEVRDETAV